MEIINTRYEGNLISKEIERLYENGSKIKVIGVNGDEIKQVIRDIKVFCQNQTTLLKEYLFDTNEHHT